MAQTFLTINFQTTELTLDSDRRRYGLSRFEVKSHGKARMRRWDQLSMTSLETGDKGFHFFFKKFLPRKILFFFAKSLLFGNSKRILVSSIL